MLVPRAVCFFGVALLVILFELRRVVLFVRAAWRMWLERRAAKRAEAEAAKCGSGGKRPSQRVLEAMEGGGSAGEAEAGAGRREQGVRGVGQLAP